MNLVLCELSSHRKSSLLLFVIISLHHVIDFTFGLDLLPVIQFASLQYRCIPLRVTNGLPQNWHFLVVFILLYRLLVHFSLCIFLKW